MSQRANPAMVRHRARWCFEDVRMRLRNDDEMKFLARMVGPDCLPLAKYAMWTESQIVARCRNLAAEPTRRNAHRTGYEA